MAITLQCPRCLHQQKIDDDKIGKEVLCKICHHSIKTDGAAEKPKPELAVPEKDAMEEGVQAGLPSLQSEGAVKKEKAGAAAKKRRDREDDDDRPMPRSRGRSSNDSAASMLPMILIGGAVVLLAFTCIGGGFGAFFLFRFAGKAANEVAQKEPRVERVPQNDRPVPPPDPFQNPPPVFRMEPFPPFPPFPQPNLFPMPPPFVAEEKLDPADPTQIERVLELLRSPADLRNPAFSWLNRANPEHPRRAEVAKQMEQLVDEELKRPITNFFAAYFRWATSDNVPSLMKFAESTALSPWDKERRHNAITALGKLKETRAAEIIAAKLGDIFDSGVANSALIEMGPAAQPAVLKYFNDPDFGVRARARNLLQGFGAKPDLLLTQCLTDLDSPDVNRRGAALQWLATSPVNEKRRPEVSKALNKSLDHPDCLRNGDLVKSLENWCTNANVAKLAEILKQSQFGNGAAIRILGQLRDPDGIKAVAKSLENLFNQHEAKKVLKENPAVAEPAVIEMLSATNDNRVRQEGVRLLGEIGPRISVDPLCNRWWAAFLRIAYLVFLCNNR